MNLNKHCAQGDISSVKRMLMSDMNIEDSDYDGRTPLHLAASEGQLEIVEYLFDAGGL